MRVSRRVRPNIHQPKGIHMLAAQETIKNHGDDTPSPAGWTRKDVTFHAVDPFGTETLPKPWGASAICGYQCEYIGLIPEGGGIRYTDAAYVVKDLEGLYGVEVLCLTEFIDTHGSSIVLSKTIFDGSYHRRLGFYDALREAEEAATDDIRYGNKAVLLDSGEDIYNREEYKSLVR